MSRGAIASAPGKRSVRGSSGFHPSRTCGMALISQEAWEEFATSRAYRSGLEGSWGAGALEGANLTCWEVGGEANCVMWGPFGNNVTTENRCGRRSPPIAGP